jgi:hypothetical protein
MSWQRHSYFRSSKSICDARAHALPHLHDCCATVARCCVQSAKRHHSRDVKPLVAPSVVRRATAIANSSSVTRHTRTRGKSSEAETRQRVLLLRRGAVWTRKGGRYSCPLPLTELSVRFSNSAVCLRKRPVIPGAWTCVSKLRRKLPGWQWGIGLCCRFEARATRLRSPRNEVVSARSRGTRSLHSSTPMTFGSRMTAGIESFGSMSRAAASDQNPVSLSLLYTTFLVHSIRRTALVTRALLLTNRGLIALNHQR